MMLAELLRSTHTNGIAIQKFDTTEDRTHDLDTVKLISTQGEQFQNSIEKSYREATSIPLTQIHGYSFLAWNRYVNINTTNTDAWLLFSGLEQICQYK